MTRPTAAANLEPRITLRCRRLTASAHHGPAGETYKHDARSCVWLMRAGPQGDAGEYVAKRFEYAPLRQALGLLLGLHPAQFELRRNRALRAAGVPVVPIVDAGCEPTGLAGLGRRAWLITPRLGESLQRRLRDAQRGDAQRERDLAAAAALTRRLVRAGFTFRDLKPSNIVLDAEGRAHLLDVGSARANTGPRRIAEMRATMDRVLARDGVSEPLRRRFAEMVDQGNDSDNERATRTA